MAQSMPIPYSDHFYRLGCDMKRYLEKISVIRNEDPYLLKKVDFCKSYDQLPTMGYPDIVFYLLHTTSFVTMEEVKNYKSLQSYRYFTSGWVLDIEWKVYPSTGGSSSGSSVEPVVLVRGKVRHSYSANKPPLLPWVIVKQSGPVVGAHCTCMAGLAETCSHVGALLHWIEAAVRVHLGTTSTSKENSWIMPTPRESIPFLELNQISFRERQPNVEGGSQSAVTSNQESEQVAAASSTTTSSNAIVPTADEQARFFEAIALEKEKVPIVLSVLEPFHESFTTSDEHLPPLFSVLYDPTNLDRNYTDLLKEAADYTLDVVSSDKVLRLSELTTEQSESKQWFKYRAGRITASRFKQVVHTNPHQPSLSLLTTICYPETSRFNTEATNWGCTHETTAVQAYQQEHSSLHPEKLMIRRSGFNICAEQPFLGASPDGLVDCAICGQGILEVKCPFSCRGESQSASMMEQRADGSSRSFCLQKDPAGDGTAMFLDHRHSYYYQCQLQLHVTKLEYCDFVVWSETKVHVERIHIDKPFIERTIPIATKFWRMCVLPELMGKIDTMARNSQQQVLPLGTNEPMGLPLEEDQGRWCYCNEEKGGDMVGCDNKSCPIKWFHIGCVGMTSSTVPQGRWLCPTCHAVKYNKNRVR